MSEKKKMNKNEKRLQMIRIACIFMAFLMIFSALAAIIALF